MKTIKEINELLKSGRDDKYRKMTDGKLNRILALHAANADPEWQKRNSERMKERHEDPEWQKRNSERMKNLNADPEYKKRKSEHDSERMKKQHADPEYKKYLSERMKKQHTDPEYKKYLSERKKKPVKTPEGIFDSGTAWAEFTKLTQSAIYNRMKKYPDQYYYISKEEYEKLTKDKE